MDTLLDEEFAINSERDVMLLVKWWNKKRLLYNVILIVTELAVMLFYWSGLVAFGIENALFYSFLYTLVANVLYLMGPGLDITLFYYIEGYRYKDRNRQLILILGIVFSVMLTWYLYEEALLFSKF